MTVEHGWWATLGTLATLVTDATSAKHAQDQAAATFAKHRRHPVYSWDVDTRPATAADVAVFERARDGADTRALEVVDAAPATIDGQGELF